MASAVDERREQFAAGILSKHHYEKITNAIDHKLAQYPCIALPSICSASHNSSILISSAATNPQNSTELDDGEHVQIATAPH